MLSLSCAFFNNTWVWTLHGTSLVWALGQFGLYI